MGHVPAAMTLGELTTCESDSDTIGRLTPITGVGAA